jgi:hypothetical protein
LKPADTHDSTKLHFNQQQHTMILHRSDEENEVTKYVSEALRNGYLTVYLPLTGSNNNNYSSDLSKITLAEDREYEENMNRGNLLTFDTGTFYTFALAGNLQPFEELKVLIEEAIEEKQILSKKKMANEEEVSVVVVAGVAAELNRNEKFDECIKVEEWWQKTHSEWLHKGLKVAIMCPHLIPKLDKGQFMHYKQAISSFHDTVVESGSELG